MRKLSLVALLVPILFIFVGFKPTDNGLKPTPDAIGITTFVPFDSAECEAAYTAYMVCCDLISYKQTEITEATVEVNNKMTAYVTASTLYTYYPTQANLVLKNNAYDAYLLAVEAVEELTAELVVLQANKAAAAQAYNDIGTFWGCEHAPVT